MPTDPNLPTAPDSDESHDTDPTQQQRSVRSEDILQGSNEVLIIHGGAIYRLRQTKSGKLILNK